MALTVREHFRLFLTADVSVYSSGHNREEGLGSSDQPPVFYFFLFALVHNCKHSYKHQTPLCTDLFNLLFIQKQ